MKQIHNYLPAIGFTLAYSLLICLLASYSGGSAFENWLTRSVFIGLAFACLHLFGAWTVLGPGKYWQRLLTATIFASVPVVASILGATLLSRLNGPFQSIRLTSPEFQQACLFIPGALAAVQIPNWLLRLAFGWHIVQQNQPAEFAKRDSGISIADLMIFTTLIAVSFSALQMADSIAEFNAYLGSTRTSEFYKFIVFSLWLIIPYGLIVFPAILNSLSPNAEPQSSMGWTCVISVALILGLFSILIGLDLRFISQLIDYLPVQGAVAFFTMSIPLIIARQHGFIIVNCTSDRLSTSSPNSAEAKASPKP